MKIEGWALLLSAVNSAGGVWLYLRGNFLRRANISREDFIRNGWSPLDSALNDFQGVLGDADTMCRLPKHLTSDELEALTIRFHKHRQRISVQLNYLGNSDLIPYAKWKEAAFGEPEMDSITEHLDTARQCVGSPQCARELLEIQNIGIKLIKHLRDVLDEATKAAGKSGRLWPFAE